MPALSPTHYLHTHAHAAGGLQVSVHVKGRGATPGQPAGILYSGTTMDVSGTMELDAAEGRALLQE